MTEKKIIYPDQISMTTQQLIIGYSPTDQVFSTATGFLYELNEKFYLITNWHNVTGRNPITNEPLSQQHAGIPDTFMIYLRLQDQNGEAEEILVNLYEDEDLTKPRWYVHPEYNSNVDVIALPLDTEDKHELKSINQIKFDDNVEPKVGDECFVIGYPFEELRLLGLPIWKKASIATEPQVDEDGLPKLLIDTATRPGLSGSPVIIQRTGIHNVVNGALSLNSSFGTVRDFLGIYSGRIGVDEMKAQFGIVWRKAVVEEIIENQQKGTIEFQNK